MIKMLIDSLFCQDSKIFVNLYMCRRLSVKVLGQALE